MECESLNLSLIPAVLSRVFRVEPHVLCRDIACPTRRLPWPIANAKLHHHGGRFANQLAD